VYVNVDAALFTSLRQMGIGVVIRSHTGECLIACSELLREVTTPELAEALALRRSVSLAGDQGFDKMMVVSDCLSLVQRINSSELDRSPIGVKFLTTNFIAVSFSHIFRESNISAHTLARSAEQFVSICFRNSIPDCIQ
jgi:hypothetical protein